LVALVATGLVLLPGLASAEARRTLALWPLDGVDAEALETARARLGQLGEVVDLPAPSPPGPSAAEGTLRAETSARVDEAQTRYYEASFGQAASLLETFLEARGEELAAASCLDSLRHLLIWLGASLVKQDRSDEAVARFALAQTLGQDEIDRALFPPEVTEAFDRARQTLASAPEGEISIVTLPDRVELEIDGRSVDAAPGSIGAGRHLVVGRRPGFRPAARFVTVAAGTNTSLILELGLADAELRTQQLSLLRRDDLLDPSRDDHLELVAEATGAELVALIDASGQVRVLDPAGAEVALPDQPPLLDDQPPDRPDPPPRAPAWRRWWFWVSLVGGAALLSTGVGLGVYYGSRPDHLTFTIVPGGSSGDAP
jgi:hypothetical protein